MRLWHSLVTLAVAAIAGATDLFFTQDPRHKEPCEYLQETVDGECSNPNHYPLCREGCSGRQTAMSAIRDYCEGLVPDTDGNYDAVQALIDLISDTCFEEDSPVGDHCHIILEEDPPLCP